MRRRLPAFVILLLPLLACATGDGMVDKLYDSTRAYNRSLRWADFDRAAEHLPTTSANAFLDSHDIGEEELVIVDYKMTRLKVNKQHGTAAARVQVEWHTEDRLILEKTIVDEIWQWHDGRWYLVDERRVTGEPVALFAEGDLSDGEHPYLPGLKRFRDDRGIGLEGKEKTKWEREQRKKARAQKALTDDQQLAEEFGAVESVETDRRPASFH
jgi:hypothetical protein